MVGIVSMRWRFCELARPVFYAEPQPGRFARALHATVPAGYSTFAGSPAGACCVAPRSGFVTPFHFLLRVGASGWAGEAAGGTVA